MIYQTVEQKVLSLFCRSDTNVTTNQLAANILDDIAKLRSRIDELGGYHDDI